MWRWTKAANIAWKDMAKEVMLELRSKIREDERRAFYKREKCNCRDTEIEMKDKYSLSTDQGCLLIYFTDQLYLLIFSWKLLEDYIQKSDMTLFTFFKDHY